MGMVQPIILAAGKGTRMRSELPKCLHEVTGVPIARRIINSFAKAGSLPPIVIVGHKADEVKAALGEQRYVEVATVEGTADAVRQGLVAVEGNPAVVVVNGDHPFLHPDTIVNLEKAQAAPHKPLVMGIVEVESFDGWLATFERYGRLVRNRDGSFARIVEFKNATEEEKLIREVNPNVFCGDAVWLKNAVQRVKRNEVTGEYHITDLVELAIADGKPIETVRLSVEEGYGINTPEDLAQAQLLAGRVSI